MPFSPLDRPDRFGGIVILFNWEGSHLTDLLKEVFTAGLFLDPVLLLASLLDLLQVEPVPHRHRHLLGSHLRGLVSEAQIQTFFVVDSEQALVVDFLRFTSILSNFFSWGRVRRTKIIESEFHKKMTSLTRLCLSVATCVSVDRVAL